MVECVCVWGGGGGGGGGEGGDISERVELPEYSQVSTVYERYIITKYCITVVFVFF